MTRHLTHTEMASRKRLRDGASSDEDAIEDQDEHVLVDALAPLRKKLYVPSIVRPQDGEDESSDMSEDVVEKMDEDGAMPTDIWEQLWKHFRPFCSRTELGVLRRVSRLFHGLVGVSFLYVDAFQAFPDLTTSIEQVTRHQRSLYAIKQSPDSLSSIPAQKWTFSVVQSMMSLNVLLERTNIHTLHMNSSRLLQGEHMKAFPKLRTLTMDYPMALASFDLDPYENIDTLVIAPPVFNLQLTLFNQLKHQQDLVLKLEPDSPPLACTVHLNHLLRGGFTSVRKVAFGLSSIYEVKTLVAGLADRASKPEFFAPLTHLFLWHGTILPTEQPEPLDWLTFLTSNFPQLEEVWMDPPLVAMAQQESYTLATLRRLRMAFLGEGCFSIGGPELEYLILTLFDTALVTILPDANKLCSLEVHAGLQSASYLLEQLASNGGLPSLHTIVFISTFAPDEGQSTFVVGDIPSLTSLTARFSTTNPNAVLSLSFACYNLKELSIDVYAAISVPNLVIDQNMTRLESLKISPSFHQRESVVSTVLTPFLPPSLTYLSIPAHWKLVTDQEHTPQALNSTSQGILLSCYRLNVGEFQLHHRLRYLQMNILTPIQSFQTHFAKLLPELSALTTCIINLTAPPLDIFRNTEIPVIHLSSKSLQLLSFKLLPKVFHKQALQTTVGLSNPHSANTCSAIDPLISFPILGQPPPAIGRAKCKVHGCTCSGFTREMADNRGLCYTPRCMHSVLDHEQAADMQHRWLSLSLDCPQLTHLAIAGLNSMTSLPSLLRHAPLLTHLQVSMSDTFFSMTIAHPHLTTLHIARLEGLTNLHLNCPNLIRVFAEFCPQLVSIIPSPTPRLEVVHCVATALAPDARLQLTKAKDPAPLIVQEFPPKAFFPDYLPRFS